jgi:putative tryptophan/tyrosine transport system permease protein
MLLLALGQSAIERGLIYGIMVVGMYLTSRILRFDDMTIEGSFNIGGALTACCLLHNIPYWLTPIIALLIGAMTGLITGILHTKLKLNNLISGIITSTAMFSICLKISSSNATLSQYKTLFTGSLPAWIILIVITICITTIIMLFLHTELGYLLKLSGTNRIMLATLGKNVDAYKILGLSIANGIHAISGSILAQYNGYYSIWSSVGILIIILTSLIISEMIPLKHGIQFLVGSIIYQCIIAITFEMNIDTDWNKLITALLLIALFTIHNIHTRNNNA